LSEMRNPEGEEYGFERLMRVAADEAAGGARHFIARLRESLDGFRKDALRAPENRMEDLDRVVFD